MRRHEDNPGSSEKVSVEYLGPGFSFANQDTHRSDELRGVGPRVVRVIEYPAEPKWENVVTAIYEKGLIAGTEIGSAYVGNKTFAMPRTLRPILNDAVAISSNPYTYDDRALFRDIGRLLRDVAEITSGQALSINNASENIGVMKFSGIDDRRVFLVPGFECGLHIVDSVDSVRTEYVSELTRGFGARFDRVSSDFLDGFQKE